MAGSLAQFKEKKVGKLPKHSIYLAVPEVHYYRVGYEGYTRTVHALDISIDLILPASQRVSQRAISCGYPVVVVAFAQ